MGIFTLIGTAAGAYFGAGPAGAAVGAGVGASIDGAIGEDKANQQNRDLYEDNRDWQERMSNTSARRAANDFQAAGFNRILATGAQSSTPATAPPTMQNTGKHGGNVSQAILGAVSATQAAAKQNAEISNMAAEKSLLESQKKQADAQTLKTNVDAAVAKKGIPEAELRNDVYDLIKPAVQKAKEWFGTSAKQPMIPKSTFPKANSGMYSAPKVTPNLQQKLNQRNP